MSTALLTHLDCQKHEMPPGHPEQIARLEYVLRGLSATKFDKLQHVEAPTGSDENIRLAHPQTYIDRVVAAVPDEGHAALDADTHLCPASLKAARRAVGANIKAVDLVVAGKIQNAFCAIRPPGHHAETETSMGFCIFGNAAIAAKYAIEHYGLERVAIVDFDVHHGNGTQDLIWNDQTIHFFSTHQMPLYPGSGFVHETGAHQNVHNFELAPECDSKTYRMIFEQQLMPALKRFDPELIIISAGFDAHQNDPLANINLTDDDFSWVTDKICQVAKDHAKGRIVSTLEGGYDLDALERSVSKHVESLMKWGMK